MRVFLLGLLFSASVFSQDVWYELEECAYSCSPSCQRLISNLDQKIQAIYSSCNDLGGRSDCLKAGKEIGLSQKNTIDFCQKARPWSGQCLRVADRIGLLQRATMKFCTSATRWSAACLEEAHKIGFFNNDKKDICQKARRDTPKCLKEGHATGLSKRRIKELCR